MNRKCQGDEKNPKPEESGGNHHKNISKELEEKIRQALTYSCDKISYQWLPDSMDIFNDLPVHIKFEFLITLHGDLIRECPFFNSYDSDFTVRIIPLLKPVCYLPNEQIWKKNDFSGYIVFIVSGKANFYINVEDHTNPKKIINAKDSNVCRPYPNSPKSKNSVLNPNISTGADPTTPLNKKVMLSSQKKDAYPVKLYGDKRASISYQALNKNESKQTTPGKTQIESVPIERFQNLNLDSAPKKNILERQAAVFNNLGNNIEMDLVHK